MMPLFIPALIGALVSAAATLVGRVMIALGIGLVTYTGVSTGLSAVKTLAFSYLGAASSVAGMAPYMGLLQIGTCVNIMFSALAIRLVLNGLTGDSVKRWVTK